MSAECNAANIPPGYKQTEVGVIPEDWEVKLCSEISPLQRGFDLPISQLEEGPYPVVYSNGVMNYHKSAMARETRSNHSEDLELWKGSFC